MQVKKIKSVLIKRHKKMVLLWTIKKRKRTLLWQPLKAHRYIASKVCGLRQKPKDKKPKFKTIHPFLPASAFSSVRFHSHFFITKITHTKKSWYHSFKFERKLFKIQKGGVLVARKIFSYAYTHP